MTAPVAPTGRAGPAAATAARPPSFEELVVALVREGILPGARAQILVDRRDKQLAQLARAQRPAAGAGGAERSHAVGPVELLLSFGERGDDGQPLREDAVTEVWAKLLGLPYLKLDPLRLDPAFIVGVVSRPFARRHGILALEERDGALTVATTEPLDPLAQETVEQVTGKRLAFVIASRTDIERLITEFYGFRQSVRRAEQHLTEGIDLGNFEQLVRMKSDQEIEAGDEHIVHAVDYLLRYAFGQRASDIHIEPKRAQSVIRYRIDGSLHVVNQVPSLVHRALVNRIKTLARLDISEKRRPQDGRIKTEFDGRYVEIRVSTLPVAFGEKVVLRIFDPELVHDDLGELGFFERDRAVFKDLLALPHGIVLITGPTGSGKTTTLYTALRQLASEDVNVTTIEDPIEMVLEGINQTAVQPAIGLGFAETLRTLLRQDPDIIMVGEIRDLDTARHAIQAALTGHLVFSTLHTNDAPSAVTRLADLGVPHFLMASTLVGIMAQRLVKRVCSSCATERVLTADEAASLALPTEGGDILVRYGAGCVDCRRTGYKGRAAIVELFRVSPAIRKLIHERADERLVKEQAQREGMLTLRESAVRKMLLGETTFEQVVEVTTEL